MSINIYTYSNPYKLKDESYWTTIKDSFQICVSQTMVNGLKSQYTDFRTLGQLTTITNFMNHLFVDWETPKSAIEQMASVDNLINSQDFTDCVSSTYQMDQLKKSLRKNRASISESIREMFELDLNPKEIRDDKLTVPQKCLVKIYRELRRTNNPSFDLKLEKVNAGTVDDAIEETIKDILEKEKNIEHDEQTINGLVSMIHKDCVVVHGIHQFTPLMLKTIEILGKYKNVVILFNYVPEYEAVYKTWLNVYGAFESKIVFSNQPFNVQETESKVWADQFAAIVSGHTNLVKPLERKIEVIEFDNVTEFSGYVAKMFEEAQAIRAKVQPENRRPTLAYMRDQIYSANSDVNEILKIYFPEQFGEREFLDYPIGHFFLSIVNMWDPETKEMLITDVNDVYECLACGIISEDKPGSLASTFTKEKIAFSNEKTLKDMILSLENTKDVIEDGDDDENWEAASHIENFHVSKRELRELIRGLRDLDDIAQYFFRDFNDQKNDFKKFYAKIEAFLKKQAKESPDLDDGLRDIIRRVLEQLETAKDITSNASFDCLRETMRLYLQQVPPVEGTGAHWIVRTFQQIDGDILRRHTAALDSCLHLACLSDQDMSLTSKDDFPWPLTMDFFEGAVDPADWKFQVYVNSRLERKNFRRYALIYALAFSHVPVKLSYVKHRQGEDCNLFYLFELLHAKVVPYRRDEDMIPAKNTSGTKIESKNYGTFSDQDYFRYRICNYRFLLCSIMENGSVYKDDFLIQRYLSTLIENRARRKFQGLTYSEGTVGKYLRDQMESLREVCTYLTDAECIDIVTHAKNALEGGKSTGWKFPSLKKSDSEKMQIKEEFLLNPDRKDLDSDGVFKRVTTAEIDGALSKENLEDETFRAQYREKFCDYCSEREVCLEPYRRVKSESK